MKKGNLVLTILMLLVLTLGLVSVSRAAEFTIGFSQMENNMPFRIAETNSIKEIEKNHPEVKVIITDAQSSLAKQVSDCLDLIARGVDFLVIAPREYEGFQPVFDAAKKAGIPVMLIDREAAGVPGEDFVTMAGANFWYEGRQAALFLVASMQGRGNIIELVGTPGSSVARDRQGGFQEVIKYFPEMKVIASQPANFTRMEALTVMENLIQQYGDEIDAVYAHNDEMALGAIQALEAAGLPQQKKIWIVSVDGQKSAIEAIIAGKMDCSIECPPYFGEVVYDTAIKVLNGEKVPAKTIITDTHIYTAANAEIWYDPNSVF